MNRMMPQKFIAILLVTLICQLSQAQSDDPVLISSGGGIAQTGTLFLTYSLGEPCISYTQSDGHWLTEGFQQPGKINLTSVEIASTSMYTFRIYPNPVTSTFHIESTDPAPWQLVQIVNVLGQPLLAAPIVAEGNMGIDLTHLIPGLYRLTILDHTSTPVTQSFIKL